MNKAYLLIGGNEGDRFEQLHRAVELLQEHCGDIAASSALYETAAWGRTDQPAFLNQALLLLTPLPPQKLIYKVLQVEKKMGRERLEKYGPRIIDIDILFYNDCVLQQPHLTVPHPEVQNRRFALVPMFEIAPQLVHPVLQQTITQLLEVCADELPVVRVAG